LVLPNDRHRYRGWRAVAVLLLPGWFGTRPSITADLRALIEADLAKT
jgi:hypothetical protein